VNEVESEGVELEAVDAGDPPALSVEALLVLAVLLPELLVLLAGVGRELDAADVVGPLNCDLLDPLPVRRLELPLASPVPAHLLVSSILPL
jgi:hypothetical protein